MHEELVNLATEFGLKYEEVEHLTTEDLTTYFNFYHGRNTETSSILVYGFGEKERKEISALAKVCKFKVATKPSEFIFNSTNKVAFICSPDTLMVEKAKQFGTTVLSKEFFEKFRSVFFSEPADEVNIDFLFNQQIPVEYRIIAPLSNYNRMCEVKSFSIDNDNVYSVNLHKMTCTCKDFTETNRAQVQVGDIRRLCKHLMRQYTYLVGITGLSNFSQCILSEGHGLKRNIKNIYVEGVHLPVVISYENAHDWWNIYFPNTAGIYKRYGYSPANERFAYDEKPSGFVKPLRSKLKELHNHITGNYSTATKRQTTTNQSNDYYPPSRKKASTNNEPINNGCLSFVFAVIVIWLVVSLFGC